jgi:hypothetical protein
MQHRMTVSTQQWKTKVYLIERGNVARRERGAVEVQEAEDDGVPGRRPP